jgi:hypothetical protein
MFDCISYNVTFDYYEILVLMDYLLKKTILCKTSLYITVILIITKILLKVALITINLKTHCIMTFILLSLKERVPPARKK